LACCPAHRRSALRAAGRTTPWPTTASPRATSWWAPGLVALVSCLHLDSASTTQCAFDNAERVRQVRAPAIRGRPLRASTHYIAPRPLHRARCVAAHVQRMCSACAAHVQLACILAVQAIWLSCPASPAQVRALTAGEVRGAPLAYDALCGRAAPQDPPLLLMFMLMTRLSWCGPSRPRLVLVPPPRPRLSWCATPCPRPAVPRYLPPLAPASAHDGTGAVTRSCASCARCLAALDVVHAMPCLAPRQQPWGHHRLHGMYARCAHHEGVQPCSVLHRQHVRKVCRQQQSV